MSDRGVKRDRLLGILDARGADRLLLRSAGALSWYLDGARAHVSLAGDPILAVSVGRDGDDWFVFENEAERMLAEELPADPSARLHRVPWHAELLPARAEGSALGAGAGAGADAGAAADSGAAGEADAAAAPGAVLEESAVAVELRAARAVLLPGELARYRALAAECAAVLTDTILALSPDDAERRTAALLATALVERGIDPLVLLVAGRDRLGHRHPLPTAGALGDRAMLVVCGRRHGLIANVTRWVSFGTRPAGERDADRRILEVEAAYLDATLPGATLAEVLAAGAEAYAREGFEPEEWRRHHQGGAAGYAGRDPRATPRANDAVQSGQAFAWNPTAPGAKVEDTVLLGAQGIEVLTLDPRWPSATVAGRPRPEVLER